MQRVPPNSLMQMDIDFWTSLKSSKPPEASDPKLPEASDRSLSSETSTASTPFLTPTSDEANTLSEASGASPGLAPIPAGLLNVTPLSTTAWRPQYPRIGQFAVATPEQIIAATPDGLVSITRESRHPSKPWSEARPFPPTPAKLDASTVTGVAVHQEPGWDSAMHVYCTANGALHAFTTTKESGAAFVVDTNPPPLAGYPVTGTPAAATIHNRYAFSYWCVLAPCLVGGLLFTKTRPSAHQEWEPPHRVATELGIISAVSVAVTHVEVSGGYGRERIKSTDIVAAVIASGRLHITEGPLHERSGFSLDPSWQPPTCARIQHPGEVTGNPVLLKKKESAAMWDLLVPSAEGGVYHFIRPSRYPDEWHMIGRIAFPADVPMASSMACTAGLDDTFVLTWKFRAYVQCGGRIYLIRTMESAQPWTSSTLLPITGPGPFSE